MLVTGWMGVLQLYRLYPLLFVSIVAAWVCACAPDRREEACSASYGQQVTTIAKWRVAGVILALSGIAVSAISLKGDLSNAAM
jgi:hypothetical protein